jgi:hypothetical protein
MATVLAAFIGAVIGSVGAVLAEEILRRRREYRERRETLVRRYLFQLQDAVEALWHRIYNVRYEAGEVAMTPPYRDTTTVYALGRVLAAERVLTLEGVYPQLEELFPGLGRSLQGRRLTVALTLPNIQQYDRIALAEAVLERDEDGYRPSTFLAFRSRYVEIESGGAGWLVETQAAVGRLGQYPAEMDAWLDLLGNIAHQTSDATGIPTSILEKERRRLEKAEKRLQELEKRQRRTGSTAVEQVGATTREVGPQQD